VGGTSRTLPSGATVAALAVVNASGQVIDPGSGLPWEAAGTGLRRPPAAERRALVEHIASVTPPLNTTIGIVATDAVLSKAECRKFAAVAHDGLARAVRPSHLLFDGDTIFGVSTGALVLPEGEPPRGRLLAVNALVAAAADCFAVACTRAVVEASSQRGGPPSYRDLCPGAFTRR
jgi:L-aminopeptidase/D-esterase-like protein